MLWKNCVEKQTPAVGTFFRGCYIRMNFSFAKNVCKDMAHTHVIVPNFFIRQRKIILDGKPFSMQCRPFFFPGPLWLQVVNDGIRPCIPYKVKVLIFAHDGSKVLFYIPAVTEDDNIFLTAEFRHHLADHGDGKFQLGFLFLLHAVSKRNRKVMDPVFIPYWDAEHYAYETMPIQII